MGNNWRHSPLHHIRRRHQGTAIQHHDRIGRDGRHAGGGPPLFNGHRQIPRSTNPAKHLLRPDLELHHLDTQARRRGLYRQGAGFPFQHPYLGLQGESPAFQRPAHRGPARLRHGNHRGRQQLLRQLLLRVRAVRRGRRLRIRHMEGNRQTRHPLQAGPGDPAPRPHPAGRRHLHLRPP